MSRYKLVKDENLNIVGVVVNDDSHSELPIGSYIPSSVGNRHWDEYVIWNELNAPDEADVVDYMFKMRQERDNRMNAMEWRINRNYRQLQNNEIATDDTSKMTEIYNYMKALADMPQNNPNVADKESYESLVWPTEPE